MGRWARKRAAARQTKRQRERPGTGQGLVGDREQGERSKSTRRGRGEGGTAGTRPWGPTEVTSSATVGQSITEEQGRPRGVLWEWRGT